MNAPIHDMIEKVYFFDYLKSGWYIKKFIKILKNTKPRIDGFGQNFQIFAKSINLYRFHQKIYTLYSAFLKLA